VCSRDKKQGYNGLGQLQCQGLFDFFNRLRDCGGCLCGDEINQKDLSAIVSDELEGGHSFRLFEVRIYILFQ